MRNMKIDSKSKELVLEWEKRVPLDQANDVESYKKLLRNELEQIINQVKSLKRKADGIRNTLNIIEDNQKSGGKEV